MAVSSFVRGLSSLLVVASGAVATAHAAGCNTATFHEAPVCRGEGCSCEADPTQASCRGFNERDGDVVDVPDPVDASPLGDASDAGDAASDGPAEAAPDAEDI